MIQKDLIRKNLKTFSAISFAAIFSCCIWPFNTAFAAEVQTECLSRVYEFEKDSNYEFSDEKDFSEAEDSNTYGSFAISGEIAGVETKDDIPVYEVSEGNLKFYYNYGDSMLQRGDLNSWHLVEDKSNKLDTMKLDKNILNGAIVLQTSKDRKNWVDVVSISNAFSDTPIQTDAIYETTNVQLINGCYYRMIIAYELRIKTDESKILFYNKEKYDYKKCVEVYECYAFASGNDNKSETANETYNLGDKVRSADFDGYAGEATIDKNDPHYGWDLGKFFVSGYTEKVVKDDQPVVFLKNVGDKVALWFHLDQDIDKLNGNNKLSITADNSGSDQYFETPTMDFGRGTLIIGYTDHKNNQLEPMIYTNFLEANTSVDADTKVQLFEEGDYEVALDYEVTNKQFLDKTRHYRIFFEFSIRNGNCMVYPFDVSTGAELTNSSMTENGFRLDLAKSRYLKVNVKRETLTESADGLVEDTRFNGPARDGAEYTDEGIYTITVSNEYTGQFTVKKIYVGTNNILRAHMTTGLSISEINNLIDQGAEIFDDGTIQLTEVSQLHSISDDVGIQADSSVDVESDEENMLDNTKKNSLPIVFIIGIVVLGIIGILA
ncbi:MAG: hypothetical protein Q4B85_11725 [Lachnospiraceae bacterium]|nr:hypothetical protein [Lachnospiraceae bacterium]